MTRTEEVLAKQWNAACQGVGAMAIKLAALKRQVRELESDIARAAALGITLDQSAHYASQVEQAMSGVNPEQ